MSTAIRARLIACAAGAFATAVALAGPAVPSVVPSAAPGVAHVAAAAATPDGAALVLPDHALQFPRDYGSHPRFGIEWWYVTGWLYDPAHHPLGFQITFFRVKTHLDADNPSAFTPRQLLIAHCALSDPRLGRLLQDQCVRRVGLGLAQADEGDTHVWLDDWQLERHALAGGGSVYEARLPAADFTLDLSFSTRAAPMRNGQGGFSQKGPSPHSAS